MNRGNVRHFMVIGICLIASLAMIIFSMVKGAAEDEQIRGEKPGNAGAVSEEDMVNKTILHSESEVDTEIIEDGLTQMGFLVTAKYYFTEVTTTSKVTQLWDLDLGFTKSNMIISYEGYVPAGIDFTKITVEMDEAGETLTVSIPEAELMDAYIDPDSFQVLDETESIFNPFSVDDYNAAVQSLEVTSLEKAQEKGLLDEAQTNAETLIRNFVEGFVTDTEVRVELTQQ